MPNAAENAVALPPFIAVSPSAWCPLGLLSPFLQSLLTEGELTELTEGFLSEAEEQQSFALKLTDWLALHTGVSAKSWVTFLLENP